MGGAGSWNADGTAEPPPSGYSLVGNELEDDAVPDPVPAAWL